MVQTRHRQICTVRRALWLHKLYCNKPLDNNNKMSIKLAEMQPEWCPRQFPGNYHPFISEKEIVRIRKESPDYSASLKNLLIAAKQREGRL